MVVRSAAALVVVLAALAAGCGGDDSASAEEEWAASVCEPFAAWRDELRSLADGLQGSSDPLGALRDSGGRAGEATDELLQELEDAGSPPEGDAAAFERLVTGLRAARDSLETQLEGLAALAPAEAAAALGVVAAQVAGVLEGLESSLDAVRTSAEGLEQGFADAESCAALQE